MERFQASDIREGRPWGGGIRTRLIPWKALNHPARRRPLCGLLELTGHGLAGDCPTRVASPTVGKSSARSPSTLDGPTVEVL